MEEDPEGTIGVLSAEEGANLVVHCPLDGQDSLRDALALNSSCELTGDAETDFPVLLLLPVPVSDPDIGLAPGVGEGDNQQEVEDVLMEGEGAFVVCVGSGAKGFLHAQLPQQTHQTALLLLRQ